jgi:peroxin-7
MIFQQQDLSGTACKFSPLRPNLLAYGGSQHFGIAGNSFLSLMNYNLSTSSLQPIKRYPVPNSIQSISFSEQNPSLVGITTGEGRFSLFDWSTTRMDPVVSIRLFQKDALTSSNNRFLPFLFAVGGVAGELRLLDMNAQKVDNLILKETPNVQKPLPKNLQPESINEIHWHPNNKNLMGVATARGKLYLKDLSLPTASKNALTIHDPSNNILSFDFNKYNHTVAISGIDQTIKIYDLKKPQIPMMVLTGHRYAVNKVRFSPFSDSIVASGSYDMTVKGWDLKRLPNNPMMKSHERHREFVNDVDFSMFEKNVVVSCGLDRFINVFHCLA